MIYTEIIEAKCFWEGDCLGGVLFPFLFFVFSGFFLWLGDIQYTVYNIELDCSDIEVLGKYKLLEIPGYSF